MCHKHAVYSRSFGILLLSKFIFNLIYTDFLFFCVHFIHHRIFGIWYSLWIHWCFISFQNILQRKRKYVPKFHVALKSKYNRTAKITCRIHMSSRIKFVTFQQQTIFRTLYHFFFFLTINEFIFLFWKKWYNLPLILFHNLTRTSRKHKYNLFSCFMIFK